MKTEGLAAHEKVPILPKEVPPLGNPIEYEWHLLQHLDIQCSGGPLGYAEISNFSWLVVILCKHARESVEFLVES